MSLDVVEVTVREELRALLGLSWPVAVATFCRIGMYSTDTAFLGRLGADEMSASSLAVAWSSLVCDFLWSSGYALNSLCAQAIGAGNNPLAGVWLSTAITLQIAIAVPIVGLYFCTGSFVGLVTNYTHPHVDHLSQLFNEFASIALLPTACYMSIRQFFQARQIVKPATIVSCTCVGINALLNQVLIFGVFGSGGLGFIGAPLATASSVTIQLTLFVVYVFGYRRLHEGFFSLSRQCCRLSETVFNHSRMKRFLKVVIPMTVASMVENWSYQVITFSSGWLESDDVAAMSVCYNVWGVLWSFYWGWGLALQVRVGTHLGGGRPEAAKLVAVLSLKIVICIVAVVAVCVVVFRKPLAGIFTDLDNVKDLAAGALPILALDYALGCLGLCATQILEGMAHNTVMAYINAFVMWMIQVPVSIYFAFACPLFDGRPVDGFWWGSVVGEFVKAVLLWRVVIRTDWNEASREAIERSEATPGEAEEDETRDTCRLTINEGADKLTTFASSDDESSSRPLLS